MMSLMALVVLLFSHEMSWIRSGTKLSQFLGGGVFLTTLASFNMIMLSVNDCILLLLRTVLTLISLG